MARELPTGTVTLVFTDVEGSTRLLQQLGADTYADTLAQHRRALREAFIRHDGVEVDTQGDSFFERPLWPERELLEVRVVLDRLPAAFARAP